MVRDIKLLFRTFKAKKNAYYYSKVLVVFGVSIKGSKEASNSESFVKKYGVKLATKGDLNCFNKRLVASSYFFGFQLIYGLSLSRLLDDSPKRLMIKNLFSLIVASSNGSL